MGRVHEGPSDSEIVADVLAGETERFELLVRRYETDLVRMALARLGQTDLAEEAVQQSFMSAYKSLHRYDVQANFRRWLVTILINQCRTDYRRLKRATERLDSATDMNAMWAEAATADEHAEQAEHYELLYRLLDQLPKTQAEAIWLRFFGEMKYDELAAAAGCSLATAKNRVRAGLEKLGRMLKALGHEEHVE